jgi:hypothetical protein
MRLQKKGMTERGEKQLERGIERSRKMLETKLDERVMRGGSNFRFVSFLEHRDWMTLFNALPGKKEQE